MAGSPEETLESIYELLSDCEHILEIECSDQRLSKMQEQLSALIAQSESYRRNLLDQQKNSKSVRSREIAALMLEEEDHLERQLLKGIPGYGDKKEAAAGHKDLNIGALCVEYLSGRAMQSIRETLIGAMSLKITSGENRYESEKEK